MPAPRGWVNHNNKAGKPPGGGVMKRIWAALLAAFLVTAAGVAVADTLTSSKQADFFAPGRHSFYVWCSTGGDYTTIERGLSAEDAQMKLYNDVKAKGRPACWPVWQGKLAG
jgi:hypothetical protein